MPKIQYDYLMDKASDTDTFKAVMFACNMIRQGQSPGIAIRTASRYYQVDMDEVAHLVGQRGGRRNAEKQSRKTAQKNSVAEKQKGKQKAKNIELEMIRSHDGKPFFISQEENRLAIENEMPVSWFRNARNNMRDEGVIAWEVVKDDDGHIIGTWFKILAD